MKNEPLYHMPCPIARSLGRVGDGWSMLIMRDALAGFTRFDEFQKSSGVAPNILSRRLKELVEDGLLEKVCYSTTPMRFEYHLTPAGRDLRALSWRWPSGAAATSRRKDARCNWWKLPRNAR